MVLRTTHGDWQRDGLVDLSGPFEGFNQLPLQAVSGADEFLVNLFECSTIFDGFFGGSQPRPNLGSCWPIPAASDRLASESGDRFKPGWVTVRQALNHGEAEHMLIALEASRVAGFPQDHALFHRPHWVRYMARNQYVTDAVPMSSGHMILGQSFKPVAPGEVGTMVTRAVFLPELAQLPDFSNSVEDWATGNETCPLAGSEAFQNPVTDCHEFQSLMGMVNSTHFLPSARISWEHYHAWG